LLIDVDDDPVGAADLRRLEPLVAAGPRGRRTTLSRTPGGRHAIGSWAGRVIPALSRLFAGRCFG
jgi:hypothetical protein